MIQIMDFFLYRYSFISLILNSNIKRKGEMIQMLVKYKIRKETHANIKNLVKVSPAKISRRKRRQSTPKPKKVNCEINIT